MTSILKFVLLLAFGIPPLLSNEPDSEKNEAINCPTSQWPVGDMKRCLDLINLHKRNTKKHFGILPGKGWDNLRNMDAASVFKKTYEKCSLTVDGRLLIPDQVTVIPVKFTTQEIVSEMSTKLVETTLNGSYSINGQSSLSIPEAGTISGKYSLEFGYVRKDWTEHSSSTVTLSMKLHRYDLWLKPDSPFTPEFEEDLLTIAKYLELGYANIATYEAQMLVRTYGTHVVTRIVAGARVSVTNYFKKGLTGALDSEFGGLALEAAAKLSFDKKKDFPIKSASGERKVSIDWDDSKEKLHIEEFITSKISISGGEQHISGDDLTSHSKEWYDGVDTNLVAIDRAGYPLFHFITPNALPDIPSRVVSQVAEVVEAAVVEYYKQNVVLGCTEAYSSNFNPYANIDDGKCDLEFKKMRFGGAFQLCFSDSKTDTCRSVTNPKGNTFACPPGYTIIELMKEVEREGLKIHLTSDSIKIEIRLSDKHTTSIYWCAAHGNSGEEDTGALFGGYYTDSEPNALTGKHSCPLTFADLPFYFGQEVTLCVGPDFASSRHYSVPFGGMGSCLSENPFASSNKKDGCPDNYHPVRLPPLKSADSETECSIFYCTLTPRPFAPVSVNRPPYMRRPFEKNISELVWVKVNTTANAVSVESEGRTIEIQDVAAMSIGVSLAVILVCLVAANIVPRVRHCLYLRRKRKEVSKKESASDSISV